jgi:predicted GH43/DUF377 family glycosyl hydrolase
MQLALIHRPLFAGTRPEETVRGGASRLVDREHESIWISYSPIARGGIGPPRMGLFNSHHRLASPVSPWERLKIGGGAPPILTRHGWLLTYHGVSEAHELGPSGAHLSYSAGVMVLSKEHPQVVLYRSPEPVLAPSLPRERQGAVANVVFPTGVDRRDDLGSPSRIDVYYGMADNCIGVARLDVPEHLPSGGVVADTAEERPPRRALGSRVQA